MKLLVTAIFALAVNGLAVPRDVSLALQRRADAPDDVWDRAVCYGDKFVKVFPLSDAEAGKQYTPPVASVLSRWQGDLKTELKTWGWAEQTVVKSYCEFDEFRYGKAWTDAATELKIGTEGWKDIWCYNFAHGTGFAALTGKYKVGNTEYPLTGAYTQFAVNAKDGVVFAMDNLSPASAIQKNKQRAPLPNELPELRSLSDLVWAGWYRGSAPDSSNNANVGNVKYLISLAITNAESLSIISRALKARGKTAVSGWPGDTFQMDTKEGQALLGSPNGRRWGYFVNQRKDNIGTKKIDRVAVFQGKADPIMIFFVS